MTEKEVGGVAYRIERLDAMKQFHVARRLLPVLPALASALPAALPGDAPPEPGPAVAEGGEAVPTPAVAAPDLDGLFTALGPLTDAIAKMPDDDANFIIATCLGACFRANPHGSGWSPVALPNGRMMFQDIDLGQMLQLTWAAIQENLGGFFAALPSGSR